MNQQIKKMPRIVGGLQQPLTTKMRLLLLLVSGILTGLTVVFPVLGALEWISLVPAAVVLLDMARAQDNGERLRLRRIYAMGFVLFFAYFATSFHWLWSLYPLEFLGVTPGVGLAAVLLAWIGVSIFQTIGSALIVVAFMLLSRTTPLRRQPWLRVPLIAALWVILEWCQTLFWWGVPWVRLSLGQAGSHWMLGSAALLGSYGITFALVLFGATLAYALLSGRAWRLATCSMAASLLFVAGGGAAVTLYTSSDLAREDGETFRVAAIQANIGSTDKWDTSTSEIFEIHFRMTEEAAAAGVDLISWSETAVPITLKNHPVYLERLTTLAQEYEVTLLLGTFTVDAAGDKHNSVLGIAPDGSISEQCYSKRRLVPFGEFVPFRSVVETVLPQIDNLAASDLTPGEGAALYSNDTIGPIGSLICFDSIYETLARDSVLAGAQLLNIPTNDSWFLGSAAIEMHHTQSQLRAIETGRYIVRAASTGQSGIISPTGEVLAKQEVETSGILYGEVELREDMTLYMRVGNLLVWLSMAYAAAILIAHAAMKAAGKRKESLQKGASSPR